MISAAGQNGECKLCNAEQALWPYQNHFRRRILCNNNHYPDKNSNEFTRDCIYFRRSHIIALQNNSSFSIAQKVPTNETKKKSTEKSIFQTIFQDRMQRIWFIHRTLWTWKIRTKTFKLLTKWRYRKLTNSNIPDVDVFAPLQNQQYITSWCLIWYARTLYASVYNNVIRKLRIDTENFFCTI